MINIVRPVVAGLLAFGLLCAPGFVSAQTAEDGFDPDANGSVRIIEQQADGRLLIGGRFTTVGGIARNRLARINNDGSVDGGFNPSVTGGGVTGAVWGIHQQPGGKVLVGGNFSTVAGQPRANIARVNANGTLDAAFDPEVDGRVRAFHSTLSPDGLNGLIYIAGDFSLVEGASRQRIARLSASGALSAAFQPPDFNGQIGELVPETPGTLLVAGNFGTIDGQPVAAPIARLATVNGAWDTDFAPQVSGGSFGPTIDAVVVQPDGRILIGGNFTMVNGQARAMVARLHPDGALDTSFVPPSLDAPVSSMRMQPDGRIVIAGDFDSNFFRQRVARLNADGSYDGSFNTLVVGAVETLFVQSDGKIAIGGMITQVGAYTRNYIARLEANGAPDVDFEVDPDDIPLQWVNALALQPDGKVVVAGWDETRAVLRVNANGTTDSGFNPPTNGPGFEQVQAVAIQDDGKIVLGGLVRGDRRIARFHASGQLDTAFTANANNWVRSLAMQQDGKILLGGSFSEVSGVPRSSVARLHPDGSLDTDFSASTNGTVDGIAVQPDGRILIVGDFTIVNSLPRAGVARLNASGSLDTGFAPPAFNELISTVVVQTDGKVLVGGRFTTVAGQSRRGIERLLGNGSRDSGFSPPNFSAGTRVESIALLANGRIALTTGYFPSAGTSAVFVRVLATGGAQLEQIQLNPAVAGEAYSAASLVVQPDGKLLVGGRFASVGGAPRRFVARIARPEYPVQTFSIGSGQLRWYRDGAMSELALAPQVSVATACCNDADFAPIADGQMVRASGNPRVWTFDGLDIPGAGTVWLRARGATSDGATSASRVDSPIIALALEGPDDTIFSNGFQQLP